MISSQPRKHISCLDEIYGDCGLKRGVRRGVGIPRLVFVCRWECMLFGERDGEREKDGWY